MITMVILLRVSPKKWVINNWVESEGYLEVYSDKSYIYGFMAFARYEAHFVSFTNGINENKSKQINLYPNPATNTLTLNLSLLQKLQNAN